MPNLHSSSAQNQTFRLKTGQVKPSVLLVAVVLVVLVVLVLSDFNNLQPISFDSETLRAAKGSTLLQRISSLIQITTRPCTTKPPFELSERPFISSTPSLHPRLVAETPASQGHLAKRFNLCPLAALWMFPWWRLGTVTVQNRPQNMQSETCPSF